MNEPSDWHAPRRPDVRLTDRALRFVQAPDEAALSASVVVGISHRNQPDLLRRALLSVMRQDMPLGSVVCLILDDRSNEGWMSVLASDPQSLPLMVVATGRMGSPAQARNALLDLVDVHFPKARWVARLDADDELAEPGSLRAMVEAGERHDSLYVLGGNRLRLNGEVMPMVNRACEVILKDRDCLLSFIDDFCHQQSANELPSCNLLLRNRCGIRYPGTASAEDHWLVAGLLMHRPEQGAVVSEPLYSVYALNGLATQGNHRSQAWLQTRRRLAQAAHVWHGVHASGEHLLGWGQEGVVVRTPAGVIKRFYPGAIDPAELQRIGYRVSRTSGVIVRFDVIGCEPEGACIRIDDIALRPVSGRISDQVMEQFLVHLYRARVVPSNIKRDNLMVGTGGELVYVDIGRDIGELTASRFLDCAARLYAIGRLDWSDHELARRSTTQTQVEALSCLQGFDDFYRALIAMADTAASDQDVCEIVEHPPFDHHDVTLMLKACAQDWKSVERQTMHIAGELRDVAQFRKVVLLIDPHEGPFLRQYCQGNGPALRDACAQLMQRCWIDEVWVADHSPDVVVRTYTRWFGKAQTVHTHTQAGAPLFSQLWGFDQVETRYVLQADVDVLVSLTDASHDVLSDMKRAMSHPSVWSVGFNIPKAVDGFTAYHGEPGQFAPEVRFGLLDLQKIKAHQPFVNPVVDGRYQMMWHRVLQAAQPDAGRRSVRGGDSRSCYVHPLNIDKHPQTLSVVRDLVSQGLIPTGQREHWDLVTQAPWTYPGRTEDIVILALGRDTPSAKLERFMRSLARQNRQDFGVILVDDAGVSGSTIGLHRRHAWLSGRLTLIRRSTCVGYLENFRECVREICVRPETLVVVVDQDDALMGVDVIDRLWALWRGGAGLINAPMFRPDKPTQSYPVDHVQPRSKGGGNVWSHLRAFRKSLYEQVPVHCWNEAPDHACLSDFITMVPMAELARQPAFMDGPYVYLHERQPYGEDRKQREKTMKAWLFSQPALRPCSTPETSGAEQTSGVEPVG